jgi:PQQ-dependent catabolism-associated beta-propeller protein
MSAAGLVALASAAAAESYPIYVSNEKDNTITVLDSATMNVTATWKVGRRPRGVTISNDGKWLYVCASDDSRVDVVDTSNGRVVRSLKSGPDPELFVLHPSGNPLYIANEDDNMVTVVDVEKNQVLAEVPVGVEPEGMGISPDGKVLVNTSETTNMAHFIDTPSYKITDNVLVDARPRIAEFTVDGKALWVSAEVGGTVSVIDPATRKEVKKITFKIPGVPDEAIQPVGIRLTKDGKTAFVALGPANRVAVVDQRTFEVQTYLQVGQRVWQLAFTPDEKLLISTNGVSNDVTFIDVAERKPVKSVKVGAYPWGVVAGPERKPTN